jgi:hypothetical protein
MPRILRHYLIGCIAITFAYLIWHAIEPLRLNVGDPWSDAELLSSNPNAVAASPLSAIVYAAIAKLGAKDVAVFRVFALAFSALGAWAFFHYLRHMWSDSVAWLGTALFTANVLSFTYADSLQSPPLAHAFCFIALWGLVRAVETLQLRHYAAATIGAFACMFASSDDWLFLSAGALCTIFTKPGNPFAREHLRFILMSAAGAIAGALARSQFVVDPGYWPRSLDTKFVAPLVPLLTVALTPVLWPVLANATWRAVRSRSLRAAVDDAMPWAIAVAVILLCVTSPRPGPPLLRVISVLPFFATGSAIVIDRMLGAGAVRRTLGIVAIVTATIWAFAIDLCHPRAVLARADVASAREYLASHDANDFVFSNLLDDGVIHAAFDRHSWAVIGEDDGLTAEGARSRLLEVFEAVGTDHIHAVIFTDPASRFLDRSLGQLTRYRGLPAGTSWPQLRPARANALIAAYDAQIRQVLDATAAQRALHFDNFDVYRIDRRSVLEKAGERIPVVRKIELNSVASNQYELLGWQGPHLSGMRNFGVTTIGGYAVCASPEVACDTASNESGLWAQDTKPTGRAQLMIRVERSCDLRLTVDVEPGLPPLWMVADLKPPALGVSLGKFSTGQCVSSPQVSFLIPQRFVHPGINIVTFTTDLVGLLNLRADLRSLEIDPMCD